MKNTKSLHFKGHLFALLTILIWGSTFIASKIVLQGLSPTQLMSTRFLIAYILLFIVRPKFTKFIWRDEIKYLLLGAFGCTLYMFTENSALKYTLASNVSIIVATSPILTSLLAHFFLKDERLNKNIVIGFLIAFSGVIFVVFNGSFVLNLQPIGDILALSGALCWAIYSIMLKKFDCKISGIELIRKTMFYGLLTSLPILFSEGNFSNFSALGNPLYLGCTLFLAVMGSSLGYVMWNKAIVLLGAVKTNTYLYIEPFITLITAAIFIGEPISALSVVGACLIIVGVIISGKSNKSN